MKNVLRIGRRMSATAVAVLMLTVLISPSAGAAEGERVLDPTLSLIGGCIEETRDPVQDPGCPTKHPPAVFATPYAVATDLHGDIFVASKGKKADGTEGRVDIFSPEGIYISEIPVVAPQALVIDSDGILYVWSSEPGTLFRYEPCGTYDPDAEQIEYCQPPVTVPLTGPGCTGPFCVRGGGTEVVGLALDRANDHLFLAFSGLLIEYGSAEEDNEEVRTVGAGQIDPQETPTGFATGLAVDSTRRRLYMQEGLDKIGVYDLVEGLASDQEYAKIATIEAAAAGVPGGHFGNYPSLAVDEGTGDLFVYDTENSHLVELDEDGDYLATVDFDLQAGSGAYGLQIAVDNGPASPNGQLSEEAGRGRYLFAPSNPKGTGHSYAFFAAISGPPELSALTAASIAEDEAELRAQIDPNNLQTTYTFEVKGDGAADWIPVGNGTLPAGNGNASVSAVARDLSPGTSYAFRVLATNEEGSDQAEGSFSTYASSAAGPTACPNSLLRLGASAALPDCRAYELVTPADTNARAPLGLEYEGGGFATRQVSPAGDKVPFRVEGGSLPGFAGVGGLKGDPYLATRTATGWSTAANGPSGAEAASLAPGATSPDQGYSFWGAAGEGSAVLGEELTAYLRYPDGHSELLGQGSLGTDPEVVGRLISEGGRHVVFETGAVNSTSPVQLEPDAAPDGTRALYDRTPDGITHVVSLKPGDLPFGAGKEANFQGASLDGLGVAFKVGNVLYLRYDNKETFEIGTGVEFAGVAEGGRRVFYVEDENLEAFDVAGESVVEFADTPAAVVPVTISGDGSTAYFVSESVVAGASPGPEGAEPQPGGQNLYRSTGDHVAFIATVTDRDVAGAGGNLFVPNDGLGLWVYAVAGTFGFQALVPARSTPDGSVFLFKSRAPLTGYDPEGHAQIYRYDAAADDLRCLSCNPTGQPAKTDAGLQSESRGGSELFSKIGWPENLRADGRRAFFESREPLVAKDGDNLQDVYEWEDQGVGSCGKPDGCLYLVSSPQSGRDEYLWAVSRSGDDVFFLSSDLLVGTDADETPSIYDARVDGGFAEPKQVQCEGEGCRPRLTPSPPLPVAATPVRGLGDNVKLRTCRKGRHKAKRAGKVRCVAKKHRRRHAKQHRRRGRHGALRPRAEQRGGQR